MTPGLMLAAGYVLGGLLIYWQAWRLA